MCFSCCVWSRSLMCYFFFFKQKTAYEMRISDWSSDVCSSDLLSIKARALRGRGIAGGDRIELALNAAPQTNRLDIQLTLDAPANGLVSGLTGTTKGLHMQIGGKGDWKRWDGSALASLGGSRIVNLSLAGRDGAFRTKGALHPRSEEPTAEIQ